MFDWELASGENRVDSENDLNLDLDNVNAYLDVLNIYSRYINTLGLPTSKRPSRIQEPKLSN